MADDFLSQEEVDALLSNVTGESVKTEEVAPSGTINYDLTKQERIVRGRMGTLEIIYDRAARTLRQNFYSLLRKSPEISHNGIKPMKYSEWVKHLPVPASFSVLQLKGLRGNGLFVLEPGLIFATIDSLFGGNGEFHTRIEGRDFSATEQQVINRIIKILVEAFASAWKPIMPLEFIPVRSEIHAQFAQIATPSEVVLASCFKIELGETSGSFWICLPYSSIEPIRAALSNDVHNDSERDDDRWTSVMGSHVSSAPATLRFEIARMPVALSRVANMAPGDVFELGDELKAIGYCNGVALMSGSPGEANGKMAVRIERTRAPIKKQDKQGKKNE